MKNLTNPDAAEAALVDALSRLAVAPSEMPSLAGDIATNAGRLIVIGEGARVDALFANALAFLSDDTIDALLALFDEMSMV